MGGPSKTPVPGNWRDTLLATLHDGVPWLLAAIFSMALTWSLLGMLGAR